MKARFQSVNFDADVKLLDFIQKKLDKLDTFFDNIISGDVYMKVTPNGRDNKVVEIKLSVPGKELIAKKESKSFEQSADLCVEALRRSILRYKEKVRVS